MLMAKFPSMVLEDEEEVDTDVHFFYLWDTNLDVYTIYETARWYLGEGMMLAPCLSAVLAMTQEKNLPVRETLDYIACIHSGYASKLQQEK